MADNKFCSETTTTYSSVALPAPQQDQKTLLSLLSAIVNKLKNISGP